MLNQRRRWFDDGGAIVYDWPRDLRALSTPLIPALILGADAVTGLHRMYHPSFFAQILVSVGLPYQSLACMEYFNVLWLSGLGEYLHRYPETDVGTREMAPQGYGV